MGILMKRFRRAAVVASAAVCPALVAGCGDLEPAPGEFDAIDRDGAISLPGDTSATDSAGGDTAAVGSATGTWAMATDWSTCVYIGELRFELRTYKLLRVEVEQVGTLWREKRTVCSVINTPLLGQTTVFSQAVINSYASQQLLSSATGNATGSAYYGALDLQLFGAKLSQPATEAMPTSTADPRVVDSDGDGHPGGTLKVGAICELYAANRAISQVSGQFVSPTRIEGGALHDTTQVAFASSSGFCAQSFVTVPNQPHNAFVLARVDSAGLGLDSDGDGQVSCGEIAAGQAKIASWRAADNERCPPILP